MKTTKNLTISIDPETLEILKQLAAGQAQSVSSMIRLLIRNAQEGKK